MKLNQGSLSCSLCLTLRMVCFSSDCVPILWLIYSINTCYLACLLSQLLLPEVTLPPSSFSYDVADLSHSAYSIEEGPSRLRHLIVGCRNYFYKGAVHQQPLIIYVHCVLLQHGLLSLSHCYGIFVNCYWDYSCNICQFKLNIM